MKIKCFSLLVIAFLFNSLTVSAQSWLWGEQGNTALKADVYTSNVATNRTGNVYQTGFFASSITFGSTTLTSSSQGDVFLAKYDQNGNILWARGSKSTSTTYARGFSVATDDSDNSYVTGISGDITTFGYDTLDGQFFLVKYDPNGNVLWAKANTPSGGTVGSAVATDNFGHEYIAGEGAYLIKYDRNGNVLWSLPQNLSGYTTEYSVAADISGNVYISGKFLDSLIFGSYNLYSAKQRPFIAKFDSSGNVLWVKQSTDNSLDIDFINEGYAAAINRLGSVYLTGAFSNTITFGSYTFTSSDSTSNFFVIKFNPDGSIAWGKQALPINGSSWGSYSVCADDSNYVYISGAEGQSQSLKPASFVFANDTFSVVDPTYNDAPSFLIKLDSLGNVICGSTLPAGGVEPNAVTSDSSGKFVYLGGGFYESIAVGNDNLIDNTGGGDCYVARWNSCVECDLVAPIITQQGNVLISSTTQGNQWLRNDTILEGATNQTYAVTIPGWYKVINVNPANGCSNPSDSIYVSPIGFDLVYIYPNPTNNQIIVKINSSSIDLSGWNLKLIDILGRTIYSMPSLNYSNVINLETLPAAMYFVTVTNNTGRTVVPVVKVN